MLELQGRSPTSHFRRGNRGSRQRPRSQQDRRSIQTLSPELFFWPGPTVSWKACIAESCDGAGGQAAASRSVLLLEGGGNSLPREACFSDSLAGGWVARGAGGQFCVAEGPPPPVEDPQPIPTTDGTLYAWPSFRRRPCLGLEWPLWPDQALWEAEVTVLAQLKYDVQEDRPRTWSHEPGATWPARCHRVTSSRSGNLLNCKN